jgi:ABC-type tungstate transport system substrate-binding protein
MSWLYHLTIFSLCHRDIIGYTTVISTGIGEIGVIIAPGKIKVGTEIIPTAIGLVEIFISHPQVIVAMSMVLVAGDLTSNMVIEDHEVEVLVAQGQEVGRR